MALRARERHDARHRAGYVCRMKVLFIHGAPAAGKLTTARAVLNRVNGRLFDNHAAIDVARTVFDFGAPGFWALVQAGRMLVLDAGAAKSGPLLVVTTAYVDPGHLLRFQPFEAVASRSGGRLRRL